eukprot:Pgem_evm1s1679
MGQGPSHNLPSDNNGQTAAPLSYIQYEANRNLCLSVGQLPPIDGTELILRSCAEEGTYAWRYEATRKRIEFDHNGQIYCLQSTTQDYNGAKMVVGQCDGGRNEQWHYSGSYQGIQAAGNAVYGWDCRGKQSHQKWNIVSSPRDSKFTPTMIRFQENSNYCLGLETFPARSGTKTKLQNCGALGTENWDYVAETEQIVYQFGESTYCLDARHWRSGYNTLDLALQPCQDGNSQNLRRDHMGRIYTSIMKQHGLTGPRYCLTNHKANHVAGNKFI